MVFFILINCDNYSNEIEKDIGKILPKDVKFEFQSVYGVYDGVLKIYMNDNMREISEKIKTLPKIHSTMVLSIAKN